MLVQKAASPSALRAISASAQRSRSAQMALNTSGVQYSAPGMGDAQRQLGQRCGIEGWKRFEPFHGRLALTKQQIAGAEIAPEDPGKRPVRRRFSPGQRQDSRGWRIGERPDYFFGMTGAGFRRGGRRAGRRGDHQKMTGWRDGEIHGTDTCFCVAGDERWAIVSAPEYITRQRLSSMWVDETSRRETQSRV